MPALEDDEKRLRSYLLRLGGEDELDQAEERFLATSAYADLITDAENRLISDYAQDRLSVEERRAFEQNYLVTDERREQLAIARTLGELEHAVAEGASPRIHGDQRQSLWKRFFDWVAAPGPMVGFAAAAAAVLLLCTNAILFLKWQGQAQQTAAANEQIRELQASKKSAPPPVTTARVITVPILAIHQTDLSASEPPKLVYRLSSDAAGTVEIPLEIPADMVEGAIDAQLLSSGRSIWSASDIHFERAGKMLRGSLSISFPTIESHAGEPLRLDLVERGHAVLGSFQLIFEKGR